jgi:cysteinyl-tRNA synthetase
VLEALEDDLNTPLAISELFVLARAANRSEDTAQRRQLAEALRAGGWLLGLLRADPIAWFAGTGTDAQDDIDADEIESLLARRKELKRAKNYREADRIRDGLAERGILIEDVAGGTRWRRAR